MTSLSATSSLGGDLLGDDSLKAADASKLVEDLIDDTDMATFFDEEFEASYSHRNAGSADNSNMSDIIKFSASA